MAKLTGSIKCFHLTRINSVVIDTTHYPIHCQQLTMAVETASREADAEPQPVLIDDALKVPPMTTKTFIAFADHP